MSAVASVSKGYMDMEIARINKELDKEYIKLSYNDDGFVFIKDGKYDRTVKKSYHALLFVRGILIGIELIKMANK